jgi:hypothetical protein
VERHFYDVGLEAIVVVVVVVVSVAAAAVETEFGV